MRMKSLTAKSIADIHLQRRTKSWELLTLYLQLSSSPTKARCVFQNSRRALSPTKRRKIGCWLFNRSTIVTPTPRPPVCMHLRPLLRPLVFLLRFDSGTCCPPSPPHHLLLPTPTPAPQRHQPQPPSTPSSAGWEAGAMDLKGPRLGQIPQSRAAAG